MTERASSAPVGVSEFEQRLERFVNDTLLGGDGRVDRDTRLFEDGYINSLRILDLIAFIEKTLGRRIPDRAVRLANFRSIAAIAQAFHPDAGVVGATGGVTPGRAPSDARQAGDASSLERPFERRTDRSRFASPVDALRARGELTTPGPGRVVLAGLPLALWHAVDRTILEWASALGAREHRYPSVIDVATLERAGQVESFPHQLTVLATLSAASHTQPQSEPHTHALAPAVCYHAYPELAGRALDPSPVVLAARGQCYRRERGDYAPLERLWEFSMREIIVVGTRSAVEDMRQQLMRQVAALVTRLELDASIETATDPFFLNTSSDAAGTATLARRLTQQAGALKHEMLLTIGADGQAVAASSFNHHQQFFGERFEIRLADGSYAYSGCVAFGLERWVLAILAQHGVDESAWPDSVRRWFAGGRVAE